MSRFMLLLSFVLLFSVLSKSQTKQEINYGSFTHELNVGVLNLFGEIPEVEVTGTYLGSGQSNLEEYEAPGFSVGYKYHSESSAFRAGLGASIYYIEDDSTVTDKYSAFAFYSGYQYEISGQRSSVYFGADLFLELQNYEYVYDQAPDYYKKTVKDHNAYGLRPFIGIQFFVSKHVSLSTESYFYLRWFNMSTKEFNMDDEKTGEQNNSGHNMKFGPLGTVSVNFHL